MNLYPHTITVYNKYLKDTGGPFASKEDGYNRTVIEGVAWEEESHYNTTSTGVSVMEKTVNIVIPLEADTEGKTYTKPENYANLDDLSHWTLSDGDVIVFGKCTQEIDASYTIENLKADFGGIEVKTVVDFTNADMLPHWEVSGK